MLIKIKKQRVYFLENTPIDLSVYQKLFSCGQTLLKQETFVLPKYSSIKRLSPTPIGNTRDATSLEDYATSPVFS